MDSRLMERAEAAEVELVKSIFHFVSTNMLCGDWGQSDRWNACFQPHVETYVYIRTRIHPSETETETECSAQGKCMCVYVCVCVTECVCEKTKLC